MGKKDNEIIEAPRAPVYKNEAEALIAQAIDKNVPVGTMERLLAMRRELRAEKAKEEYDKAMAAFQADCPTIEKTKEVKTNGGQVAYKYAPIDSIVNQVKSALQTHGFSYKSNMKFLDNKVEVTIIVTHSAGHSEATEMTVPLGTRTGIMSETQVVAAAQTFAKRYAFCNAFGILTGDEDNDAVPAQGQAQQVAAPKPAALITPFQRNKLFAMLPAKGKTEEDLHEYILRVFNKKSVNELTNPEASKTIEKITSLPDLDMTVELVGEDEVDIDEAEAGIEKMKKENI